MTEWTVIGLWFGGDPRALAIIKGSHAVYDGSAADDTEEGLWAVSVEAADASEAETLAVQIMRDEDNDTEEN